MSSWSSWFILLTIEVMPHRPQSLLRLLADLLTKDGTFTFSEERSARSQRSRRLSTASGVGGTLIIWISVWIIWNGSWWFDARFLHYSTRLRNRRRWSTIDRTSKISRPDVNTRDTTLSCLTSVPVLRHWWFSLLVGTWCLHSISWIHCIRV